MARAWPTAANTRRPGRTGRSRHRVRDVLRAYKAFLKGLDFKKRFVFRAAVEKPIVRHLTGLDGNWKVPAYELANVHYNYGEEPPQVPGLTR